MGPPNGNRSRGRSRSRSGSPLRKKRYDDPREHRSPAPSGLLVRNISLSARPEDLRVPFERFGPVKDVYLPKNYYTGEPRGFGFVKFRHPEDAADAKNHLDQTVIDGREIRIVFAEENRKTPQEMRRVPQRTSTRGSHRRRSPSMSPRRRYRSYSRSSSPVKHGSRASSGGRYPRRSRSFSRSISPRNVGNHRSRESPPRRTKSHSRSGSPHDEKRHVQKVHSPTPKGNGEAVHGKGKWNSLTKNSRSPASPR